MITKKNSKAVVMMILIIFNISMLSFTVYNLVSINSSKKSTLSYQSINGRNKDYFSQLSKILDSLNKNELTNLKTLSEYYVYESSIEAISNRELFKKKGINLPQYTVSKELTNFDDIIFIQPAITTSSISCFFIVLIISSSKYSLFS